MVFHKTTSLFIHDNLVLGNLVLICCTWADWYQAKACSICSKRSLGFAERSPT
jgi:hypothetical protein